MTESEFIEMCEDHMGYCTSCKDWTRETTEPDARNYDCPDCKQLTVVGAENALLEGLIPFEG